METTTKTETIDRELTKTEINIAIAQIDDRFMRVFTAQYELAKYQSDQCDMHEDDVPEIPYEKLIKSARTKHGIPEGVYLFFEGWYDGYPKPTSILSKCKRHLGAFAKGELSEKAIADLYFLFEELYECDYGWILLDSPMGHYGEGGDAFSKESIKAIEHDFMSVGTRSKKKARLPLISGWV